VKGTYIPVSLLAIALATPLSAQNARTPVQLDAGLGTPVGPAVATDGETSMVLWKESGTNNMYVSTSSDRGLTWSTATRVDSDATAASKFASEFGVAASGGNLVACWSDDRNQAFDADLFYTISNDGGLTWSADIAADKGLPSLGNDVKDFRALAEGQTIIFVTATEDDANGGPEQLFATVSVDGGATFGAAFALSAHGAAADVDALSADLSQGVLHVVWQDNITGTNAAYYTQYTVPTGALVTDVLLSTNASAAGGIVENDINVSAAGNNVIATFQNDYTTSSSLHELSAVVSSDGGATWTADAVIGGYTPAVDDTDHPVSLALDNGNFVIAYEHNATGSDEIYALSSTDGGLTWVETASLGGGGFPAMSGGGDYVGINWTGTSFPEGSQLVTSNDAGATFVPAIDAAAGQIGDADFAECAFNSLYGNFMLVWLSDDSGANQLFAGGARSQSLNPVGPFTAGGTINFDGAGFGSSEAGNTFMVLISTATGSALVPGDGRDIGLAVTPTLLSTASAAPLMATLDAFGAASTPAVTFPGSFPIGTTLSAVALSRLGGSYASITDIATITVL